MPVINENDTVATNEIRYGDNDRLAARVATMASADLLVLLSDVDGLYDAPPGANAATPSSCRWSSASRREIEAMAGAAGSELSRGGMQTKIEAGKIATHGGHPHGDRVGPRRASAHRRSPTARAAPGSSRRPIRSPRARNGSPARSSRRARCTIDAGAVAALRSGHSLLPAGVIRIDGAFARGDAVMIRGPDGAEVGRGLVAYDAEDADKIKGRSSADILSILGFGGRAEMVHRDHLVVGRS